MAGTGARRRKQPVKPPQLHQAGSLQDRHHSRFAVSLPVRCRKATGRSSSEWRGRTTNVGGGGLALELAIRLRPHTRLAIEIHTAIGPMRVEAEVLDLPIHALLGEWLRAVAKRGGSQPKPRSATPRTRRRRPRR